MPFEHNLEFLVDPFFKKTTQMFDEASATGMLLNNLLIHPNHMISLDSSGAELVRQEAKLLPCTQSKHYKEFLDHRSLYRAANERREVCAKLSEFLDEIKRERNNNNPEERKNMAPPSSAGYPETDDLISDMNE